MKSKNLPTSLNCALAAITVSLMLLNDAQAANKYKVLHNFLENPASRPEAALLADSVGNLYGTAAFSSGHCGCGAVFKLTRELDGKRNYSVIHRFKGPDGQTPVGSLIFDLSGNLYGTTEYGGVYGKGTVFALSPSGSRWRETVLYSFGGSSDDLTAPQGALTFDANGNLFGTASSGGTHVVQGGIFELKRSGKRWKEAVVYDFTGGFDGGVPVGNLIGDSEGNLYGTTFNDGNGFGVVFELTPSVGDTWTETVLYTFEGQDDGGYPAGVVIFDTAGNLYGTTSYASDGYGTVFELAPSKDGWMLSILHTFFGEEGATPVAGLVFDSIGNLYGTTQQGGDQGDGVVFKLSESGNNWTETVLHSFNGSNGGAPSAGLIVDSHGALYGNAAFGGGVGYGVVFRITP